MTETSPEPNIVAWVVVGCCIVSEVIHAMDPHMASNPFPPRISWFRPVGFPSVFLPAPGFSFLWSAHSLTGSLCHLRTPRDLARAFSAARRPILLPLTAFSLLGLRISAGRQTILIIVSIGDGPLHGRASRGQYQAHSPGMR